MAGWGWGAKGLALNAPITTAADSNVTFLFVFKKYVSLNISCKWSVDLRYQIECIFFLTEATKFD